MKLLASALVVAGALVATQASAVPSFSLGGFAGQVEIKFTNYENFSGPVTPNTTAQDLVENFGILRITSIEDPNLASTLWANGAGGAELTGVFRDIMVSSVTGAGAGLNVKSTGGVLDIYINPLGSLAAAGGPAQGLLGYSDAGCSAGDGCYDGITNVADGALFLSLQWVSGVDVDPTITVNGDFNLATLPTSGKAEGYLDVIGGLYAWMFDTNGQATIFGGRDVFAQNDFCPNGETGCSSIGDPTDPNAWQLISNDPVRANVIPEPGSLALLGMALLGFAGIRRKIGA